jgi:deoxyribodipyrimidine photo-lyase
MSFPLLQRDVLESISRVDPIAYCKTRNFTHGAVTRLSPYISRGFISGKQVLDSVLARGYDPKSIEKFIQELAWRDYWQQLWIHRKDRVNTAALANPALRNGIPRAIVEANTGILAIDQGIQDFYQTGYLHNHLRMYIASIACNAGQCQWQVPAQWMYYHLLDADWASNALSWQWVAGINRAQPYIANQENINTYCGTRQKNTFLDCDYAAFPLKEIPSALAEIELPTLHTPLPQTPIPAIDKTLPTFIYNFYNIDPEWKKHESANRILLLEPSVFEKYPVSAASIDFCIQLATQNIPGIQVWVAEFDALKAQTQSNIYYKEHPLNQYQGIEEPRTWLSKAAGEFPSFFAFWKQCKKDLY